MFFLMLGIDMGAEKCYPNGAVGRQDGLVAQLDRVFDYESKGRNPLKHKEKEASFEVSSSVSPAGFEPTTF